MTVQPVGTRGAASRPAANRYSLPKLMPRARPTRTNSPSGKTERIRSMAEGRRDDGGQRRVGSQHQDTTGAEDGIGDQRKVVAYTGRRSRASLPLRRNPSRPERGPPSEPARRRCPWQASGADTSALRKEPESSGSDRAAERRAQRDWGRDVPSWAVLAGSATVAHA
jgi:hypothetical protein